MLAMVAAIKEETRGIKNRMNIIRTVERDGFRLFEGFFKSKEILLVQTGIGQEKAEKAVNFILEQYPVSTLISFGFAGALTAESKIGDICVCSKICCDDSSIREYCSDISLLSLCLKQETNSKMRLREAKIVTVNRPVCETETRLSLGEASHCDIVDMESYRIATIASRKQIPFISIRAISDTVGEKLPPFDAMINANGKWRWEKIIPYFIFHPGQIPGLYRNFRLSGDNLTAYFNILADRLLCK